MNQAQTYAQTLLASYNQDPQGFEGFFQKCIENLQAKRKLKLLPAIMRELERHSAVEAKAEQTVLLVKDQSAVETAKQVLAQHPQFDTTNMAVVEEPNIVGGFLARSKRYVLDNSYRSALLRLYRQLVA